MALITWNPNDKGSGVTLANSNLTVTIGNNRNGVRATEGKTRGKWYWEIYVGDTTGGGDNSIFFGVANSSVVMDTYVYDKQGGRFYYRYNGNKFPENVNYGDPSGSLIGVALNMDEYTLEFYRNGVSQGISHTNLEMLGEVFPCITQGSTAPSYNTTANFGATPFKYPIPEGYMPYDVENASWFNPRKFLLKSDNSSSISTIDSSGSIIATTLTEPLTKENFKEFGFTDLNLLIGKDIAEFELLINSSTVGVPIKIQTEAIPFPQLVLSKGDIVVNSLKKIINFSLTVDSPILQNIKVIFSVDSGASWMTYSNTLGEFEEIDISNLENVKNKGVDSDTFNSLGSRWNEIITDNKIKFGYYLEMNHIDNVAEVDELSVLMEVYGKFMSVDSYKYTYGNRRLHVKLFENGDYKINHIK